MEANSPSIGGWTMEYATGGAQKGPVLHYDYKKSAVYSGTGYWKATTVSLSEAADGKFQGVRSW